MPRRCALAPLAITHLNVLFPRPPPAAPVRPATHSTVPASFSSTFDAARHPPLCRRRRRSFSLPRPYSAASHDDRRPSLAFLPFVLSGAPREAAMTRVNLPQTPDRYRRTLTFSLGAPSSFTLLPTTATPPPPVTLLTLPLYPSVAAAHPATNLLRMLALYARLTLNV